jgi:hypothetical protein
MVHPTEPWKLPEKFTAAKGYTEEYSLNRHIGYQNDEAAVD